MPAPRAFLTTVISTECAALRNWLQGIGGLGRLRGARVPGKEFSIEKLRPSIFISLGGDPGLFAAAAGGFFCSAADAEKVARMMMATVMMFERKTGKLGDKWDSLHRPRGVRAEAFFAGI